MGMNCPFCDPDRTIICSNASAVAIRDAYPVSEGHTLVIPVGHEPDLMRLNTVSYSGCFDLVRTVIEGLIQEFDPAGFNVGVNIGKSAGQTVEHAHIHVIPRYENDTPNPRGGVRGVIPGKAIY